jgi:hypothetical protein
VLGGLPILSVDEMIERVDSVEIEQVRALAAELFTPGRLSVAGVGPDEAQFLAAIDPLGGEAPEAPDDAERSQATGAPGAPGAPS